MVSQAPRGEIVVVAVFAVFVASPTTVLTASAAALPSVDTRVGDVWDIRENDSSAQLSVAPAPQVAGKVQCVLNPAVQEARDAVPFPRPGWHGACAEMGCLSQALDAGVNPAGGSIRAIAIGTSNPGHGLPKMICSSCSNVLEVFGVKH